MSLAVAVGLYTRFGINGSLSRDEAIYAYAGQQLTHGVPPYASIFDPKTPLASLIAGGAAGLARLTGHYDLYGIRAVFCACACLAVLVIYLMAVDLWHSVLGGIVAAVVFASFIGFAQDALSGPDAKTPGVLFAALAVWWMLRRWWLLAGVAASLAFLVWQPFAAYLLVVAVAALLLSADGQRLRGLWRAAAGAALPVVAVAGYFAVAGAFGKFIDAAFRFPLVGIARGNETVGMRISHIAQVVNDDYKFSGALIWAGLLGLLLLAVVHVVRGRRNLAEALRSPLVVAVMGTLVLEAAYAVVDFQDYPDVYPFLPYAALGVGGLAAAVAMELRPAASRRAAIAVLAAAVVALTAFSWSWFSGSPDIGKLAVQRVAACGVGRIAGPSQLYALGSPVSLVLTHRRNPDRFIYLGSGVETWKISKTPGGFDGWVRQITAIHPAVIVTGGWWNSTVAVAMLTRLKAAGYSQRYVGAWRVLLTPAARARAHAYGVRLTSSPIDFATGLSGRELPACG